MIVSWLFSFRFRFRQQAVLDGLGTPAQGDLAGAQEVCRSILLKDPNHVRAAAELASIDEELAQLGTVTFQGDIAESGIELYVNDVYHGTLPESLQLPAGLYTLRLVREGYKDWIQKVQLTASDKMTMDVEFEKKTVVKKPRPSEDDDPFAPTKKRSKSKNSGGLLDI